MQGIISYTDTFGGRKMAGACSGGYTFGFNGQYKDDEVYGEGNSYTAEFWQYDPRLGRRWNLDPKPQISISDFACFGNNPILNIDPNGAWFFRLFGSTKEQRQAARNFAEEYNGKVKNYLSKNIHVNYDYGTTVTVVNEFTGRIQTSPCVVNTNQFFYRDGLRKTPNTISQRDFDFNSRTGFEQIEDYSNSDSENYREGAGKLILGIGLGVINAPSVFISGQTWSGKYATEDEKIDAFSTLMPSPFGVATFSKTMTRKQAFKFFKSVTSNDYTRKIFGDNFKKVQGKAFNAAWESQKAGKSADRATKIIENSAEFGDRIIKDKQ